MLPIIMLILCGLSAGGYFAYTKFLQPKLLQKQIENEKDCANLEINVKDFGENEIFTLDGNVISIFKLTPINVDLLTPTEKDTYVTTLTGSLASVKNPYKLISLPRPFDIQPFIEALMEQKKQANDIQKNMINEEIAELHKLVMTGSIVERHFYLVIWDKISEDYIKNRTEFVARWKDGNVNVSLLNKQELVRLCNLIFNPSYTVDDNEELNPTIPILEMI